MTRLRVSLIGLLVLVGCSDFHLVRPNPAITVRADPAPLPLRVGVRQAVQAVPGGYGDFTPAFVQALTKANLFASVLYPVRPDDQLDLVLETAFSGKFVADDAQFPKAIFTGILLWLPAPFVEYEHHFQASGTVRATSVKGLPLRSYEAKSDIPVVMKILAPADEIETEGIKATTADLLDRLAIAMQQDRAYWTGVSR